MKNRDVILILVVFSFALAAAFLFFTGSRQSAEITNDDFDNLVAMPNENKIESEDNFTTSNKTASKTDCVSKVEQRLVRGDSMSGLIENGQTVKILFGYYTCRLPERGDIIAYKYAGNQEPLIKIIKASPGDSFELEKTNGGYNILINNEILKNSQNQPYILDEKGYKMLSLYERDYKSVIPQNAYLVLGNRASGSLDSSRFGLIDKSDILGKIVIKWAS